MCPVDNPLRCPNGSPPLGSAGTRSSSTRSCRTPSSSSSTRTSRWGPDPGSNPLSPYTEVTPRTCKTHDGSHGLICLPLFAPRPSQGVEVPRCPGRAQGEERVALPGAHWSPAGGCPPASAVNALIKLVDLVHLEHIEPQILNVVVTLAHDERAEDYRPGGAPSVG